MAHVSNVVANVQLFSNFVDYFEVFALFVCLRVVGDVDGSRGRDMVGETPTLSHQHTRSSAVVTHVFHGLLDARVVDHNSVHLTNSFASLHIFEKMVRIAALGADHFIHHSIIDN